MSFLKDGDIFQILVGIVHASMTKGSSHFWVSKIITKEMFVMFLQR